MRKLVVVTLVLLGTVAAATSTASAKNVLDLYTFNHPAEPIVAGHAFEWWEEENPAVFSGPKGTKPCTLKSDVQVYGHVATNMLPTDTLALDGKGSADALCGPAFESGMYERVNFEVFPLAFELTAKFKARVTFEGAPEISFEDGCRYDASHLKASMSVGPREYPWLGVSLYGTLHRMPTSPAPCERTYYLGAFTAWLEQYPGIAIEGVAVKSA